jgi:hypothetical protein
MVKKLFLVIALSGGLLLMAQQPLGRSAAFLPGTVETCVPETYSNPTTISLANGMVFDTRLGEPALPANLKITDYAPGTTGYYIVQFDGPIYGEDRRLLETSGAQICSYLPNYAYVVKMGDETKTELLATSRIGWIGIYQPAYKVSPELDLTRTQADTALVLVFAGEPLAPVKDRLIGCGGKVLVTIENKWRSLIKVAISPNRLTEIAGLASVYWIEPFHELRVDNSQAQWVIQTFASGDRKIWDKGLKGQGQVVSTCDSGIRTSHDMFRDPNVPITDFGNYPNHRKIIAYQKAYPDAAINFGDEGGHGTHTSCTVCGNDSFVGGTSPDDGMAPEAKIFFLDASGPQFPSSIEAWPEYTFPIAYQGGARIISNSWGSNGRSYDAMCFGSDQVMWDFPDYLVLCSAGNAGPAGNTGSPANAKNVVAVGATLNGASANSPESYSSIGPSLDGRRKPTVMAPGDLTSAYFITDASYVTWPGTSMSCPVVAGNAALIRQYFTEGWYPTGDKVTANGFIPSGALLKAMLINSVETDFTSNPVPGNRVGWGRPKIDNALYFSGEDRKLKVIDYTVGFQTGMALLATVQVAETTNPFRVTLVWSDWPGSEIALKALVNDLNLEVTAPNGDVFKGNIFANNESKTGGSFDSRNVEENVFVNSPAAGTWQIRIKANNVPFGPQPFALVVTGGLSSEPMTAVSISGTDVDDAGQSNPNHYPEPGETVKIKLNLKNSGDADLSGVTGTLTTTSSAATILDPTSNYGTIARGGTAAGDGFKIALSSTAKDGDTISLALSLTRTGALDRGPLATLNIALKLGEPRYPYANHNIGNAVLTVTEWGSIGFHDTPPQTTYPQGGWGFKFPKNGPNWLYLGSLIAGTDSNYVADRMYGSNNTDWVTTTSPDGQVTIGQAAVSDQDSRARFDDSGHPSAKGLEVYQRGFAWKNDPNNDFVILRYKLINKGSTPINSLYTGIMADFDMPAGSAQQNKGGVDGARRLAYVKQDFNDNPHVGVKLLFPHQAKNVSLLENPVYVYQGQTEVWHDTTAFKFLNGAISQTNGDNSTDWSVFVSAGPINLAVGAEDTVAFAFVGGNNLSDIKANADHAQSLYDTLHFVEQPAHAADEPVRIGAPGYALAAGSPTPFRTQTTIAYEIARKGMVTISVYNALGAKVRTLVSGVIDPGTYTVTWNGRDQHERKLPAGIYFYRMKTESFDKILKTVRVE